MMMMEGNKKGDLGALIVKHAMGPEEEKEEGSEEVTSDSALTAAGASLMSAMRSNDAGKFAESLKEFIKLCSSEPEHEPLGETLY